MNPQAANQANCAVLTVAPFPAMNLFDPNFDFDKNSGVFAMLPNLFTALVGQSRFLGESLTAVLGGVSFSRFVMAPSDTDNPNGNALQCATLGAFGGFFERGFRAHDYQLGRRNCQKFLRDHFRLSADNPIMQVGLQKFDTATRDAVIATFDPGKSGFIPIIPLCGSALPEVPAPARASIAAARVGHIVNWIVDRLHTLTKALLDEAISGDFDKFAARSAADTLISTWGRAKIKAYLQAELKDVIKG